MTNKHGLDYFITGLAIQKARDFFNDTKGGRPNVPDIMVLITDGQSTDMADTIYQASLAKFDEIKLLAIGIGHDVNLMELNNVASGSEYVYQVGNFTDLVSIEQGLVEAACNISNKTEIGNRNIHVF